MLKEFFFNRTQTLTTRWQQNTKKQGMPFKMIKSKLDMTKEKKFECETNFC